jgi:hypothetical protein
VTEWKTGFPHALWSEGSEKSTKTFDSTSVPDRDPKQVRAEYIYGFFFSPQWRNSVSWPKAV